MTLFDRRSVVDALLLGGTFLFAIAGWAAVDLYSHRNDFADRRTP